MIETYKNFNKEAPNGDLSKDYPTESAVCYALEFAGHTLPYGLFKTAYESLVDFMKGEEVDNFYKNNAPILYGDYRAKIPGYYAPASVLSVLIYGVNAWLKKDILTFEELNMSEIREKLEVGNPVLVVSSDGTTQGLIPFVGIAENKFVYPAILAGLGKEEYFKPFWNDKKWVITIKPAEPVI